MIRLNNTPKKLFNAGFIAIKFKTYVRNEDFCPSDGVNPPYEEPIKWVLSLLNKDEYYAQHGTTVFVRNTSIESMVRLKYTDHIEYICNNIKKFI